MKNTNLIYFLFIISIAVQPINVHGADRYPGNFNSYLTNNDMLPTDFDSSMERYYMAQIEQYLETLERKQPDYQAQVELYMETLKRKQPDYPDLAHSMNKPVRKHITKNSAPKSVEHENYFDLNNPEFMVLDVNSVNKQVRVADRAVFRLLKKSSVMPHNDDNAAPRPCYQPWLHDCNYPMYLLWRKVYGKKDYASKQLSNKQRLPKKLHKKVQ